jgi:hypothetical protein
MAKRIFTTLLAAQLLVMAGLCGGVCCATRADWTHLESAPAQANDNASAATAEAGMEGAHCPLHSAKAAKPTSPDRETHSSKASRRLSMPRRGTHYSFAHTPTVEAHFCACDIEREKRSVDALLQRPPEQRWAQQTPPGAPYQPQWMIERSVSQTSPTDHSHAHAPPFGGLILNLRI